MSRLLVLITGTGRSGTSTISGSLHHLGLHVPGPYLGANESNPKGFYESTWAVRFHKRITVEARIHDFDSRPGALARARAATTPEMRERLVAWLREHSEGHDQVVVKDPRSVWAQRLWKEAAAEAGLEIRYLSMLRHPAEVVGSRTTYYSHSSDEIARLRYETFNVARWVNNSLVSERETRGEVRSFVPYTDLLDDWRPVIARVRDELGLTLDTDLSLDEHHPVDDFIDPGLRRHQVTWDDIEVPEALRDLAQALWADLMILCRSGGSDAEASVDLDVLAERYLRLFTEATWISHDATREAVSNAKRAAEDAAAAQAASPGGKAIRDAGGRELLVAAGRRLTRRVRRG
ncbi:MAG: sulfotransferase family protein [Nocardioides sp.]